MIPRASTSQYTETCLEIGKTVTACPAIAAALAGNLDLTAVSACCSVLSDFNNAGCFCNAAVPVVVGPVLLNSVPALPLVCPQLKLVSPSANNCPSNLAAVGECGVRADELDAKRFLVARDLLFPNTTSGGRLTSAARQYWNAHTSPDIKTHFDLTGDFSGQETGFEYIFAVSDANFNKGQIRVDNPAAGIDTATASYAGNVISASYIVNATIYGNTTYSQTFPDVRITANFSFANCSDTVTSLDIALPAEPVRWFALGTTQPLDLCGRIQLACNGTNAVYNSVADCAAFMETVPEIQCTDYLLEGNSRACRYLHLFLAELDPKGHCPHVSPRGGPDFQGNFRCHTGECGQLTLQGECASRNATFAGI
ncbi:hypothetical protein WJX72_005969 [[Myrmecia] bisecta]|uniref:Extracellular membrane protein CFEM domain-containing protein n=1 Tax=[Myrmecia] bisecta TaxID=41462 RepID=A0AAW1QQY1_9CHLO